MLSVMLACSAAAEETAAAADLSALVHQRDARGNFAVVGTNNVEAAHLLRWIQVVSDRVQQFTGVPLHFRGWRLQVVCPSPHSRIGTRMIVPDSPGLRILLILDLPDYSTANIRRAETALCSLLLTGYLLDGMPAAAVAEVDDTFSAWFSTGLAGCLWPEPRRNSRAQTLHLWRNGQIPALRAFLNAPGGFPQDVAVTVLDWWGSLPERSKRFETFFKDLRNNSAPEMVHFVTLSAAAGAADMDEEWDFWLQRNAASVVSPSQPVSMPLINRLRSALLLNAADFDNDNRRALFGSADMAALIPFSGEEWVTAIARANSRRLRLMAVGQSDDFDACVEAYAVFLDKLAKGAQPDQLIQQWELAEAMLDYLVFRLRSGGL